MCGSIPALAAFFSDELSVGKAKVARVCRRDGVSAPKRATVPTCRVEFATAGPCHRSRASWAAVYIELAASLSAPLT